MNDKLRESLQYLKQCAIIENEAFKLYETISKKLNQPESSFILGVSYNSLKNAKIIQGILDSFDTTELENKNIRKELAELTAEITLLENKISKINNLEYLVSCEILKETISLESLLNKVYAYYLESNQGKLIADELSKTGTVNWISFKKVFEHFTEEKEKNKEAIIESVYVLETKETETRRQITPIVKYQNPDTWVRESTISSFSNFAVVANNGS
jgi:DNA gyrase/topoisomerase IV subunit A